MRKKNAIAGHCFASFEAFEAHLARWERAVANVRIHGTTGEAPIARFEREEAHRLKPLGGRPSFGSLRELTRVAVLLPQSRSRGGCDSYPSPGRDAQRTEAGLNRAAVATHPHGADGAVEASTKAQLVRYSP